MKRPAYFLVGIRPVMAVNTADGGMTVLAFDWTTGEFERALEYLDRIMLDRQGDTEQVSKEEFEIHVERLRAELREKKSGQQKD